MNPDTEKRITLETCNKNTILFDDEINNRFVYLFNYNDIKLDFKNMWDMFWDSRREILKHPLIFNYINERTLNLATPLFVHSCIHLMVLFSLYYIMDLNYLTLQILYYFIFIYIVFYIVHALVHFEYKVWAIFWQFVTIICLFLLNRIFSAHLLKFTTNQLSPIPFYELEHGKSASNLIHICIIFERTIHFVRILRCYPGGIYAMMLFKLLESFVKTIHLWVLIGLCFGTSFKILMKDNGFPWESATNETSAIMAMLGTFTKISAMMTGELNGDEILKQDCWITDVVLIIFESIAISLAVGDVKELRATAEEQLIFAKIWYCSEVDSYYNTLETIIPFFKKWNKKILNNTVFIHKNGDYVFGQNEKFLNNVFPGDYCECHKNDSTSVFVFNENSNVAFLMDENIRSNLSNKKDSENVILKIKRWLFGLNWSAVIKIKKFKLTFV